MIRHIVLLIFRNFKRFKSVFFINLVGLSTGLTCVLLIYLWVSDELQMDQFHVNGDRLYRIMEHRVKADGIWTSPATSGPLAEEMTAQYPEIEYSLSETWIGSQTLSVGEKVLKSPGLYASKKFFNMFSYGLLYGDPNQVLAEKNSVVISESLSKKFFESPEQSIGKTIRVDQQSDLIVSGVFKDVGFNSSDRFDFVGTWEFILEKRTWLQSNGNTSCITAIMLKPGVNVTAFEKKISDHVKRRTNGEVTHRTMFLKKYNEYYLYGQYENGVLVGGRITYVKLFSIIAVFILVIACINFMNLSTAKASRRIKEVGIKKAIGANRKALILQYLGESLFMSFASLVIAILLTDLILPLFNEITGKSLELSFNLNLTLAALLGLSITGIMAGSYPALYLSSFSPATVLKGRFTTSFGELWARKGLVVFQFALSVTFIVCVIVVYKQIEYLQSKGLGYDRENVISLPREGSAWTNLDTFLNELKSIPGVVSASSHGHTMSGHNSGTSGVFWDGKDPQDKTEFEVVRVNYGTIEMLGIEMAEGRAYSKSFFPDTARVIFSEAAIKFMGLKNPIGKTVSIWGQQHEIIGISKDFNYESLHEGFKPVFLRLEPENTRMILAKLERGKEQSAIAEIKKVYEKFAPGFVFEYQFLDENYQSQYVAEQRVATLSKYFAGLAILISCLGLFGLAAFTAERRLKEIGIRKVLGSSEFGIIYLLSSEFTKIVLVANVFALPAAYVLSAWWLEGFAFRIGIHWWFFLVSGLSALVIAWLTVGTQAFRAARVSPTKCLRDE
ncbi:ABC transporter permease [Chryseolinea sp. T2]|uniref:ABC transporter permease n=1 Tax=Chryseolinea sp. T2 TaxID=3129255 RepID=UPI00307749EC